MLTNVFIFLGLDCERDARAESERVRLAGGAEDVVQCDRLLRRLAVELCLPIRDL